MIAQEFVILEFGVVERVLAKDDARVGRGGSPSANGLYHRLAHVFCVTVTLESLQRRPVAAVSGVTKHQNVRRIFVIWKEEREKK